MEESAGCQRLGRGQPVPTDARCVHDVHRAAVGPVKQWLRPWVRLRRSASALELDHLGLSPAGVSLSSPSHRAIGT